MKLYAILRKFGRFVSYLYFADVHAAGTERIPDRGPVMIAANHPSSILDAILLSTQVERPIRYLARSGLFRWPVLASLFHLLGAIPIYRAHESAHHARRNEVTFARVYEVFERGGCIGIFPEGRNSPQSGVAPLRSGAARMALSAEARNAGRLGLEIVPAGIAYESREFLISAVAVRFGPSIRVADYSALYAEDPAEAIDCLTRDLEAAIRHQALHVEDRQLAQLAGDLAFIFARAPGDEQPADAQRPRRRTRGFKRWLLGVVAWYRRGSEAADQALGRRMHQRERITATLAHASAIDPEQVAALRRQVERYKDHLRQTRLRRALDESFDEPAPMRWPRIRVTAYAVALAPVAAFGLAHNILPYLFTRITAGRVRDDAVRMFAGFGIGLVAFAGVYAGIGLWLWYVNGLPPHWTAAYLAALPPAGIATLGYRRTLLVYRHQILLRTFFWNRRELIELLRRERQRIIERYRALAEFDPH